MTPYLDKRTRRIWAAVEAKRNDGFTRLSTNCGFCKKRTIVMKDKLVQFYDAKGCTRRI
ncbi:MAG: hypothetical protein HC769_17990 [Cyanobacteria bacterium CRU_2_1]|nr:hypothetical protein [Cyanobacteria bacterium CRU_2_1]